MATWQVLWDSIIEIEPLGGQETYDLTVQEHHNFVADDFFVHNTTDQGYSFPRALFAAAPGALSSIESVCGYLPATTQVSTIEDATKLIKEVSGKFEWLVIDDFSFMAEQTFSRLEKKLHGFKMWGKLRDVVLEFRDTARFSKVSVVMNCWEQPPKTAHNGAKVRGGPRLSGNLPEQVPAMCDTVLRAAHDLHRQPWPAVYLCRLDPSWVMKDRFNVATAAHPCPMNLAELLRASGTPVPRHPDLPDQEAIVEALSEVFGGMEGFAAATANEYYTKLLASGMPVTVARWTLRDALDRAEIRRAIAASQGTFIDVSNPALL